MYFTFALGVAMRFSADITIKTEGHSAIATSYRRNFTSLIKEAINPGGTGAEFYEKYYSPSARKVKPFTFSVSFSEDKSSRQKGLIKLAGSNMGFHFSSSDPVFLIHVYNGLVGMKKGYPLFKGCKAEIDRFRLMPEKKITRDECVFKTYSPVIVRNLNRKNDSKGYIGIEHKDFSRNLAQSIASMCEALTENRLYLQAGQITVTPLTMKSAVIKNYGGEIGTAGAVKIQAPCDVLQLIYDAGLGAKRSQGFGMVEIAG